MINGMVVVASVSILLLFVSMVLASMGAADIVKGNYDQAHREVTNSALVSGFSTAALAAGLGIYFFGDRFGLKSS